VAPTERPFVYHQPQLQQPNNNQALNHRSSAESSRRSLVLFPDDIKAGLVRPFRAVSTKSVGPSNSNQARPGSGKLEVVPNYRTVIGASYDDRPLSKTVDDDFEDLPTEEAEEPSTDKKANFTKQELYDLCVKEVPDYLRNDLCGSLLEPVVEETTATSTTSASTSTSTAASTTTTASTSAKPVVDVAPKNSQLIQSGNNKRPAVIRPIEHEAVQLEVVTEKSVRQESYVLPANANNNYLGIPLELPVEVKRKSQQEEPKPKDKESETTFKVYRTSAEIIEEPTVNQEP